MKKLPVAPIRRKSENTISLINIVFLMLIFFLIAGQLAPPMDSSVDLIDTRDADPAPPPDALVAREDGNLFFRGEAITIEAYLAEAAENGARQPTQAEAGFPPRTQSGLTVRLVADKNLPATKLVDLVGDLQAAGAGKVTVVTMRAQ